MTITLTQKQIQSFQKEILEWYHQNKRDLPWRDTRDPYCILVSEVMSQQTQIARVVPKYLAWIERFPTIQSLAEAPTAEVLRYWNGLGYNRRALYLQRLAKTLVQQSSLREQTRRFEEVSPLGRRQSHKKKGDRHSLLPDSGLSSPKGRAMMIHWRQTEKELRQLPGIGEYTARALLCFAFNKQVVVVDTNVRKVILTKFGQYHSDKEEIASSRSAEFAMTSRAIEEIAQHLLPQGRAYEWNQALMDYASAMLKEHKIPIPKQSKFKDSDRYYRGQIVKVLLEKNEVGVEDLMIFFTLKNNHLTIGRLKFILQGMEKDTLLQRIGKRITLP